MEQEPSRSRAVAVRPRHGSQTFQAVAAFLAISLAWASSLAAAPDWFSTLSKEPPGNFPPLRPLRAKYNFGWGGITAATAEVQFSRVSPDRFQVKGTGRTSGLARALWRYDVLYLASTNASTLQPIEGTQTETVRAKKTITHLQFSSAGVSRTRTEGPGAVVTKTKDFSLPNLFDLPSGMLYLRSQPLKERSVERIVVYPTTSAYLATTTVLGHEKISVRSGTYNAIKMDLQLKKLGKDLDLQPHRKFRRATIWVSDDHDRLILRIEAQIFVGTIFAELQSVRFEEAKI
ncbi:MAG: hypothetical protein QOH39_445 [Verrucomicrobiota bacterium]|jgi:hypothetical protein